MPRLRSTLLTLLAGLALAAPAEAADTEGGVRDAVVVAVLDGGLNPYHHDLLASRMPQHRNASPADDLPLRRPASEWLPGFAEAERGFASFERLDLSLTDDPNASATPLYTGDTAEWAKVRESSADALHGVWFPGTKVIGALNFSRGDDIWAGTGAHGVGTTSSVVGNIHGTCPECLLFFIDYGDTAAEAEAAIEWAEAQPWIDVISNSYGHGGTVPKIYAGSDTEKQRAASDRGQTIVFSAGNGVENAYAVTNPTTFSSQKGPDWLLTVGAVAPEKDNHYGRNGGGGGSFFGAGKPVDVAGVGGSYPNAYTATRVGGTGTSGFGGTSNAAPTVAGLYANALFRARTALAGPSKVQQDGVIARGPAIACGAARPGCELGDGELTATELRTRVLHAAVHTAAGFTDPLGTAAAPRIGEQDFLAEGHGTFFARQAGPRSDAWLAELDRIVAPLEGRAAPLTRPAGEAEWFVVDSYCRQKNWGSWTGGAYVEGRTPLPAPSPTTPARNAYAATCPGGPTPAG